MFKIVNSLKRLIGRIKLNKITVYLGMGIFSGTSGFTILFVTNQDNLKIASMVLVLVGLALCLISFSLARIQDRKDSFSQDDLINSIKELTKEIKLDREERNDHNHPNE